MPTGATLRRLPWTIRYGYGWRFGSALRRFGIAVTHRHCTVEFQGTTRLGPGFALDIPDGGTLVVGPGVDFRRRFTCEISGDGRVEIGAGTIFSSDALIQCSTAITIGRRCAFAQSVLIVDGSHRFRDPNVPMLDQGYDFRPITIGDHVAVMAKSTVIADVGEHSFVGANSVVTKPIPAYSLAVGAPARVIETYSPSEVTG